MIKTHWLIIQERRRKRRQVMAFQVSAGIGDQGKTCGMRFGKSIKSKRSNRPDDLLLCFAEDSVTLHASAQLFFDPFHSRFRTFEAHRAAQLLRFAAGKVGGDHGHAQQLLLKQRHAQRSAEHGFKRWMWIRDRLSALPSLEK